MDKSGNNKRGIDTSINIKDTGINNNRDGTNKSGGNQGKNAINGIGAKRAMLEEDIKKEPILAAIMELFDGELLN